MADVYEALSVPAVSPGRPFTHPDRTLEDLAVLSALARQLDQHLAGGPPSAITRLTAPDGRALRLVVRAGAAARTGTALAAVGFFGQRRPDADPAPLDSVDDVLVQEFLQQPLMLAYCSQELPTGQWGNLVLMAGEAASQAWRESERHRHAAADLAPGYYASVRIHNLALPDGLAAGRRLVLLRTKYYDYAGETWRGLREQQPPLEYQPA